MPLEAAIALIKSLFPHLTKIQELVFRYTWDNKTYLEMADLSDYDAGHLKDIGSELWQSLSKIFGERVTKQNVREVITKRLQQVRSQIDYGEAIDVSRFYGRDRELQTLEQWIIQDRCRLVALLGIGGVGKTALSVKLAQKIETEFEFVIWRSLRDAPLLDDFLAEILLILARHNGHAPAHPQDKRHQLLHVLQHHRCPIVTG